MMLDSGSLLLTRSPNGPMRSAGISGRVPTLLPMEANIHLASVDGTPNPPALVEVVLGLVGEGSESADQRGTPPGKTTVPPPLRLASGSFRTPTALRCLIFCMLVGQPRVQSTFHVTCPLPEGFDGDEGSRLLVRHVSEAAC